MLEPDIPVKDRIPVVNAVANQLAVPASLSDTPQYVQDENGSQSAVSLSTGALNVSSPGAPTPTTPYLLNVFAPASIGMQPCAMLNTGSNEASLRFFNATDNIPWHVGCGGGAGQGTFFLWNPPNGVVVTIGQTGVLTANGITTTSLSVTGPLSLDGRTLSFPNMQPASAWKGAPLQQVMIDPASGQVFYQ